jgi:hypothetical protein
MAPHGYTHDPLVIAVRAWSIGDVAALEGSTAGADFFWWGAHTAEPLLNTSAPSTLPGDRFMAWPLMMQPYSQSLSAAQRIETGEDALDSAGPREARFVDQWVAVIVLARNGEGGLW